MRKPGDLSRPGRRHGAVGKVAPEAPLWGMASAHLLPILGDDAHSGANGPPQRVRPEEWMASEPTTQGHPDTESDSARPSTRVVVSEDLPLTLFIAAVTTVVLSGINTVPELLWIGVLVAPVLADALKHWISEREGWGKRRLPRLTGILAAGGSAEGSCGGASRPTPLLPRRRQPPRRARS